MSQEQTRVLEMVAEGTISVDDATRLLEALERGTRPDDAAVTPPTSDLPPVPPIPPLPPFPPIGMRARRVAGATGARAGTTGFTFEQLTQLANLGIDATFVRRFREAGLDDLGFHELIRLGNSGAEPNEFKRVRVKLRSAGIDPTFEEVVDGLSVGVDVEEVIELIDALDLDSSATPDAPTAPEAPEAPGEVRRKKTTVIRTTKTSDG